MTKRQDSTVASLTKEVNPRLAKRPLVFNGRLANRELASLVKRLLAFFDMDIGILSRFFKSLQPTWRLCTNIWNLLKELQQIQ